MCFRQFQFIECVYFDEFWIFISKFLTKFNEFCFIYNDFSYNLLTYSITIFTKIFNIIWLLYLLKSYLLGNNIINENNIFNIKSLIEFITHNENIELKPNC